MPYATRAALIRAARELAQDGVLNDPTNDDIVIAAYELCGDRDTNLNEITAELRNHIIRTYDNNREK